MATLASGSDEEAAEAKTNLYKLDLQQHATSAENYVDHTLTPSNGVGNPCSGVVEEVGAGAWVSPAATTWADGLDTLGKDIKTAFSNYANDASADASQESDTVMVPGDESWKASWESVSPQAAPGGGMTPVIG